MTYCDGLGPDGCVLVRERGEEGCEELRGHQVQVVQLVEGVQSPDLLAGTQPPHQLIMEQLHSVE